MSNVSEEINKLIMAAATDGTFTNDAVKRFHAMVDKVEGLEDTVKADIVTIADLQKEVNDLRKENDTLKSEQSNVARREGEIKAKEIDFITLELKAKHESQRVTDHQNMFNQVFRNTQVRKNAFGSMPYGEHGCSGSTNSDETVIEE